MDLRATVRANCLTLASTGGTGLTGRLSKLHVMLFLLQHTCRYVTCAEFHRAEYALDIDLATLNLHCRVHVSILECKLTSWPLYIFSRPRPHLDFAKTQPVVALQQDTITDWTSCADTCKGTCLVATQSLYICCAVSSYIITVQSLCTRYICMQH